MNSNTVVPVKLADAIRALAMDAVQQANSGHPGAPMGMAEMAQALFTRHLRHNPADPAWANRDRFVLSNGHGSMLIYALLHLTGYDLPMDELRKFRQLHSKTPGHPEVGITPGIETTTGPLGQGLANAVGMALAEALLAAEFNRPVLDALRQPLESGVVSIARAGFQIELPARFQLVLASNPCPCGKFVGTGSECSCAPIIRRRYLARLSGPLLDRIDVRVTLNRPTLAELDSSLKSSVSAIEDTATARARVLAARARAAKRFENTPWLLNANVPGPQLRKRFPLNQKAKQLLLKSAKSFSARGIDRTIRIAWTIADLADHPEPTISDIEQALIFRDGNGSWQC
jgi:hypothetical protein